MDKKQQQYSRQGSSKALSSESRKNAEQYSNKPWPKNSNRRENPNYSASKNESQRGNKVDPAKTRPNVDKRPKARGGPNNYGRTTGQSPFEDVSSPGAGLASKEDSNQFDYELNSVYAPGCKKQNLNHLLNFHYSLRDSDNYSGLNVFGKNGNNNRSQVKKHKYNKEQYLQANFQFVVNWKAKQKTTLSSPDTLIDWDLIEQINIQTTEEPQCPICLYPPVAAKLTRCGHAYCWPCILHYLALSDKTWRKCPICYEAIHTKDLKSTIIVQQVNFSVGNIINLHLMQRKKGSLSIEKFNSSYASEFEKQFHMYSASDDESKFAKLLVANRSDVISIIEREQHELAFCEGEENCPEFVFVQQALDLLKARKLEISKEIDTNMEKKMTSRIDDNNEIKEKQAGYVDTETPLLKSVEDEHNAKYYYFYQSVDGQNIFLHPLNVKMLQACYGSLDKAPLVINANILQKEHHSMDEYHRRKFTCLGHLPLTCHFEIVEVQLGPPIINEDVLSNFKDDILQRKKARLRRDREEKKREIQIDAINDRQMGKLLSSTANINLSSSHEFPSCGFEETLTGSPNQFHTDAIDIPVQPSTSKRNTYSSVANSIGSPKAEFWPTLRGAACSPSIGIDSTWSKESTVPRARMPSDRCSESDSTNEFSEEFHPAPKLGDVLVEAISQKHNTSRKNESTSGGNKKSKKNKKMLLFSTGMNFNGK